MSAIRPPHAVSLLVRLLDEAYDRKAWHGPNLRGAIRGLDLREAAWRPMPGRHNIWEIVVHAAYWKYAARRRILGEKRGTFPVAGSNWFERPVVMTPEAWRQDVVLLDEMHRRLRALIYGMRSDELRRIPRGSRVSTEALVAGVAAHDVYHAGQIQLLKRLVRSSVPSTARRAGSE